jgi:hypothetical protein
VQVATPCDRENDQQFVSRKTNEKTLTRASSNADSPILVRGNFSSTVVEYTVQVGATPVENAIASARHATQAVVNSCRGTLDMKVAV